MQRKVNLGEESPAERRGEQPRGGSQCSKEKDEAPSSPAEPPELEEPQDHHPFPYKPLLDPTLSEPPARFQPPPQARPCYSRPTTQPKAIPTPTRSIQSFIVLQELSRALGSTPEKPAGNVGAARRSLLYVGPREPREEPGATEELAGRLRPDFGKAR